MSDNSSRGKDWEGIRLQVLARDGYRCAYCGRDATEVDHIMPKKHGGTDVMTNLVAACRGCNASKGAKVGARTDYINKRWLDRW